VAHLRLLTTVIVVSQIGLTLLNMAVESFLGSMTPEEKGRASGWYQAGMAVGSGCGGGAALWLSQQLSAGWMVGAVVGGAMLGSALPLLWLREPPEMGHGLFAAMRNLGWDLKKIALSRAGLLGIFICLSPVGAGAAQNYFGPSADDWGASANVVAIVTGVLGGLVTAVGAVVGGWLSDRTGRLNGYAIGGALTALVGLTMALAPPLAPHAPWSYVVFTLGYQFFNGVAAAGFTGLVLETIGGGAVATKYNVFASISNLAISYTTRIDGKAHKAWGANGMFYTDTALTFAAIAVLVLVARLFRPKQPAPAAA
jgi:MFS family permease